MSHYGCAAWQVCEKANLDEDIFVGMMGLDHFVPWTSWHKSCWVTRGYTHMPVRHKRLPAGEHPRAQ